MTPRSSRALRGGQAATLAGCLSCSFPFNVNVTSLDDVNTSERNQEQRMYDPRAEDPAIVTEDDPNSLAELLQELRILLQGAQVLAGFLVVLPFSARFADISSLEKGIYLAAFLATLSSLILFSAPAIHHRLQRPLANRIQFKNFASRMMVMGAIPLSVGLTLATQVAVAEVAGELAGTVVATIVAAFIAFAWWISPRVFPNRRPGSG